MSRKCFALSAVMLIIALVAVPSFAADKVLLRYAYKAGEKYVTSMTQHSDISQQVGPNSVEMKQDIVMDMRIDVLSVDPQGVAELKYTYDHVALKQDSAGGKLDYDSTDPARKDVTSPAIMGYKALVGQSITAFVSPNGEVKGAKGFDKIADAVLAQVPEGEQREAARAQIGKMFSEERFNQQMAGLSVQLPEAPVAVGSSWHRDQNTEMGFVNFTIKSDYKVSKITHDSVEVALTGTVVPGAAPAGDIPMSVTIGDKSTQHGTIHMNPANPAITDSTVSQALNLVMTVQGQSINQTVASTVNVSTKLADK